MISYCVNIIDKNVIGILSYQATLSGHYFTSEIEIYLSSCLDWNLLRLTLDK